MGRGSDQSAGFSPLYGRHPVRRPAASSVCKASDEAIEVAAQELARTAVVDPQMLIEEARITLESRDEREASRRVGEYCGLPDEDFSLVCRRARQAAASLMGSGFVP